MTVSLQEVSEFVSKEATRRNGKIVPTLPGILKRMVTDPHFYIFTVGPWKHERQLGGRGSRTLQGCPEGKKYSEPLTMPVLDNETVAADMNKMENRQEDGQMVVDAFLMKGYGFVPDASLENWGVAVIDHWPPTKDDLVLPTMRLNEKLDQLVADGDRSYEQRKFEDITELNRMAVRRRKLQKPWMNENPDLQDCKNCGETVKPNIAECPHCHVVLDLEKHKANFPEKYQKAS